MSLPGHVACQDLVARIWPNAKLDPALPVDVAAWDWMTKKVHENKDYLVPNISVAYEMGGQTASALLAVDYAQP